VRPFRGNGDGRGDRPGVAALVLSGVFFIAVFFVISGAADALDASARAARIARTTLAGALSLRRSGRDREAGHPRPRPRRPVTGVCGARHHPCANPNPPPGHRAFVLRRRRSCGRPLAFASYLMGASQRLTRQMQRRPLCAASSLRPAWRPGIRATRRPPPKPASALPPCWAPRWCSSLPVLARPPPIATPCGRLPHGLRLASCPLAGAAAAGSTACLRAQGGSLLTSRAASSCTRRRPTWATRGALLKSRSVLPTACLGHAGHAPAVSQQAGRRRLTSLGGSVPSGRPFLQLGWTAQHRPYRPHLPPPPRHCRPRVRGSFPSDSRTRRGRALGLSRTSGSRSDGPVWLPRHPGMRWARIPRRPSSRRLSGPEIGLARWPPHRRLCPTPAGPPRRLLPLYGPLHLPLVLREALQGPQRPPWPRPGVPHLRPRKLRRAVPPGRRVPLPSHRRWLRGLHSSQLKRLQYMEQVGRDKSASHVCGVAQWRHGQERLAFHPALTVP